LRAPNTTADLKRDLEQARARIEELKEELEAAQFLGPVTEATAARLTEADAQAYQQERSTRAEIDWVRGAYVALFPVDAEARRAELETLRRELHLDDPEFTTPAAMRPRTNRADLLSPLEYIAKLSAEAEKNTDPLPATKPIALKWESATPDLDSILRNVKQDDSNNEVAASGCGEQLDDILDRLVGAVIGGFESAVWAMLRVWSVVEAAVGKGSAQSFVEEQK
jgi:DNA repair exonuclease SbcCD ATPase subunit